MKGTDSLSEPLPIDIQLQTRLQSLPLRTPQKPSPNKPNNTNSSVAISTSDKVAASFDDINAALASASEDEDLTSSEPIEISKPAAHPDHYWTARLLAAGFTIDECQQIRSLPRETILQHARLSAVQTASPQGYTSKSAKLE
jgi:hypothetical protein